MSMNEGLRADAKLLKEYEESFDNEEKVTNSLKITSDSFTIETGVVDFKDLSFSDPKRNSRKETYLGLTKSVAELGIVSPIHVMITEGYADWIEGDEEGGYPGFKYSVIDGFRRIFAGTKNGLTRCNAVIWNFKDKELGSELATVLSMILNKREKYSWSEVWYLMGILELQGSMTLGTIEYLLQLESGDALKLRAVMECNLEDIKTDLLSGKKTLLQCYNALQKALKEVDRLAEEDTMGISEVEDAEEIVDKSSSNSEKLSDEEVKEILDMADSFDGELSDDDFDDLMGNNIEADGQTVGERHPLDPNLRAAVLQRDGYCCQVTGRGKGLPANIALAILNVHHIIPVHCGGKDVMDNLITVCLDVHTLIHIIERNNGRLGMSREEYNSLPEEEQVFIKGVMKIARAAVEANRRMGKSREQVKKEVEVPRFMMPGVVQKQNIEAIKNADKVLRKTE